MITRDFLMRQIYQMAQALAKILFKKQTQQYDAVQDLLEKTFTDVTGFTLDEIRRLSQAELLDLCDWNGGIHSEKALALADLLIEDAEMQDHLQHEEAAYASRERALWLYEAAFASGGTVPLDIHVRLTNLRALLTAS